MSRQDARRAVDELLEDLNDRRGLRQEWEAIDSDIQGEIVEAWTEIVFRNGTSSDRCDG